ncbi:MAG: methyltransferase domain-containing protein [Candidatus Velthaea sp.]
MADDLAAREQRVPGFLESDRWFDWLLSVRHGGDAEYAAALQPQLEDIRNRLLDHAALTAGLRIADIGCGDGFAGFGALEREPTSAVTFVDLSPALIAHARASANERGVVERCRFLVASAESLGALPTASVDVVLVRALLAYVPGKAQAVSEFRRILRPGGRISIVDPIFADRAFSLAAIAAQLRAGTCGPATRYFELLHRWRSGHYPDTTEAIAANPLTCYNERDLLRLLENAGFVDVHLRLHIDSVSALPMAWPAFLGSSPYAGAPTVGEILQSRFEKDERREFEHYFRAGVEAGTTVERNVNAYLFAQGP